MQLSKHFMQAERTAGGSVVAGEDSRTARRKGRNIEARVEW